MLASDAFNQVSPGCLGNGCSISPKASIHANDLSTDEASEYPSLCSVAPGETRSLTLPYVLSSSFFADVAYYEELDLGRFSLEIGDYATGTLYRFALA